MSTNLATRFVVLELRKINEWSVKPYIDFFIWSTYRLLSLLFYIVNEVRVLFARLSILVSTVQSVNERWSKRCAPAPVLREFQFENGVLIFFVDFVKFNFAFVKYR